MNEGKITVNGRESSLEVANVAELLRSLGYDEQARGVAVACNGRVVPRGRWAEQALAANDEIEIVGAVQGG